MARFPRPHFDGSVLTWADLAAGPDACPDVPCAQESRFTPAGRSGLNPVTFCELAWHGVTVRGPQPAELDLLADRNVLRAFTTANLRDYWRPWWRAKRRPGPLALAIGLSPWFPVWAGPTPATTTQNPNDEQPYPAGSTSTITTDPTPPSEANHPSPD